MSLEKLFLAFTYLGIFYLVLHKIHVMFKDIIQTVTSLFPFVQDKRCESHIKWIYEKWRKSLITLHASMIWLLRHQFIIYASIHISTNLFVLKKDLGGIIAVVVLCEKRRKLSKAYQCPISYFGLWHIAQWYTCRHFVYQPKPKQFCSVSPFY